MPEEMLFPRPRHFAMSGSGPAGTDVVWTDDSELPPEGYRVAAGPDGVTVAHADAAGRRHAEGLLTQLRAQHHGGIPCFEAEDHPAFAVRGYMLDVSRDRVPTRDTLARIVDLLALARFNHLELYVEHTFAYAGQDEVWGEASPLTPDDLAWLDERCSAVGIELVANQNTFGHMERWLKHPSHVHRAECPDGFEVVPGVPMPPTTLAPTDDNAAFAVALVREQAGFLSSSTVNVGCDEAFELGRGLSAEAVAERGKGAVYLEHLARIVGPLLAEGRRVLYWGDIARKHPELLATLPAGDLVALAWSYEAPGDRLEVPPFLQRILDDLGIDLNGDQGFGAVVAPFVSAGVPFWVCPGTSSWNSLVGRIDNATANILDAAVVGAQAGAAGFLLTDWGDNGHLQPPSVSFGPIAYAGAVAWCPEANATIDLPSVLDRFVFADRAGVLGGAFDRLGRLWRSTGQKAFNSSPLQAGLCPSQMHFTSGPIDIDATSGIVAEIDDILADLEQARPECADGAVVVDELATAARLARHGAWRLLTAAGRPAHDDEFLRDDLTSLIQAQQVAWLARSRPGGLSHSLAHLRSRPGHPIGRGDRTSPPDEGR